RIHRRPVHASCPAPSGAAGPALGHERHRGDADRPGLASAAGGDPRERHRHEGQRPGDRCGAPAAERDGQIPTRRQGEAHDPARREGADRRRDARPAAIARPLGRRDAFLYLGAAALGSFGLGVAAFYLNFLYRALGFDDLAIGLLVGAQAIGVVAGAIPAALFTRGRSRRAAILVGGTLTGAGIVGILVFDALVPLFVSAALIGFGGIIAAASIVPVLAIHAVPVERRTLEAPKRNRLVRRFLVIEVLFGFGAGSFLPFLNLFFADRYGVPFSALGLLLGVLAVAGSVGALLHGRFVAARLGAIPSVVLVETLSLPFAVVAAFTMALPIAVAALAVRHFLMFGASGTVNAFQLSSFTPAERAGANAVFALAWSAANAAGAVLSGAVRARLGPDGFTVNIVTLVVAYGLAAILTWRLFAGH